jgi:hypothetical protein
MIYKRYGLSTPYGQHDRASTSTPQPIKGVKPYSTIHSRRESLEEQSKRQTVDQERARIKGNWKGKIDKLERDTGLELGPDVRDLPKTTSDSQEQESQDDLKSL